MRASDLLGRAVLDRGDRPLGVVADLRCTAHADPARALRLRVDAILVEQRRLGGRLGYGYRQQNPWLLRALLRRLHGEMAVVPWAAVTDWDGGDIRVDVDRDDRPRPPS